MDGGGGGGDSAKETSETVSADSEQQSVRDQPDSVTILEGELKVLYNDQVTAEQYLDSLLKGHKFSLHEGTQTLSKQVALLESMAAQLQQYSLRKSVEFDQVAHQYMRTLPTINKTCKELKIPHYNAEKPNIPALLESIDRSEEQLKQFKETILRQVDWKHLAGLLQEKKRLMTELETLQHEYSWREDVERMQLAMEKVDLDLAQECLERLEKVYKEYWQEIESNKRVQIDELRANLVEIIRQM